MKNILFIIFTCAVFNLYGQNTVESMLDPDDATTTCVQVSMVTNFDVETSGLITGGNSLITMLVPEGTGASAVICNQDIGTWDKINTFTAAQIAGFGCPVGRDVIQFQNSADATITSGMTPGTPVPFFAIDLGVTACPDMENDVQILDSSMDGPHACLFGLGFTTNLSIDPDGNAGDQETDGYDISPTSAIDGTVTCNELFAIVPVELSNFTVKKKNRDANLAWVTNSEINASHFKIYRSNDGASWDYVETVQATGNSSERIGYSYSDKNAQMHANASGDVFYRLRSIDIDGYAEYSEIRSINFDGAGLSDRFTVFPNPTVGEINLTSNNLSVYEQPTLEIFNIYGQKVARVNLSHRNDGDTEKLDLRDYNLSTGTYLLEVINNEQRIPLGKVALFN
jgi:hypothetical protein